MLDIKDTIVLEDDIEYVVVGKDDTVTDKTYYLLTEINNIKNFKYGYVRDDSFIQVNKPELFRKLLPKFTETALKSIPKEFLDSLKKDN